ncbi:MAG: hypothetical protein ACTHN8_08100 [Angustibacter sp.]
MRRFLAVAVVVASAAFGLGAFAPDHAAASCAGPSIALVAPTSAVVRPAEPLEVAGTMFFDGCADTVESGPGCSGPHPTEVQTPMTDVELTLTQRGRSWPLGRADAGPADAGYPVRWRAVAPSGLVSGKATLRAGTADLDVVVRVGS